MASGTQHFRVTVIGGGIAGLAAAFFLRDVAEVTVLEGSPRLGGKLAVSEVAGIALDEGAEALLARRPEGTGLAAEVGLAGQLTTPGTTSAAIWTRGQFRPLPRRQVMGVPADLEELAASGIVSAPGLAAARADESMPASPRDGDVSVAGYLGARLGPEVVDRLVDPLLGGVYAGRSDQLSFEATMPALAAESRLHASVTAAVAAIVDSAAAQRGDRDPGPVFVTLAGGLAALVPAVAAASGARIRTGAMVRGLAPAPGGGWRLTIGSAHDPRQADTDAVLLALPAAPASRLLAQVPGASAAAAGLAGIVSASMAIVTLAYPDAAFPAPLAGSGYLVPAVDGHAVKAVTFSTVKWPHLRSGHPGHPGLHLIRCSVGRLGEEALLQRDDADLALLAAADLAEATGVRGAPAAARVTRWGGALPQYNVGHAARVAGIRASVATQPGLAVCGAAYDGVGIPACIASARTAADQIIAHLQASRRAAVAATPRSGGQ
jgi:protoporphyrinogen/coproporphyrinogen III oxidase